MTTMIIKHKAKIVDGKIVASKLSRFKQDLIDLEGKEVWISIEKFKKFRSDQQNRALHLYFNLLAEELNQHGMDMKHFLKVDISWSGLMVKELLWKPLQKIHLGEKSTTRLKTEDINKIWDILNRVITERSGGNINVAFPSIESLSEEDFKD